MAALGPGVLYTHEGMFLQAACPNPAWPGAAPTSAPALGTPKNPNVTVAEGAHKARPHRKLNEGVKRGQGSPGASWKQG